jgi:hypothetical protein
MFIPKIVGFAHFVTKRLKVMRSKEGVTGVFVGFVLTNTR